MAVAKITESTSSDIVSAKGFLWLFYMEDARRNLFVRSSFCLKIDANLTASQVVALACALITVKFCLQKMSFHVLWEGAHHWRSRERRITC